MMMLLVVIMVVTAAMGVCLVEQSNVRRNILLMAQMLTSPLAAIMQMEMARQVRCDPKELSFIHLNGWAGFQEIVAETAILMHPSTRLKTYGSRLVLFKVQNQGGARSCQFRFRCGFT